MNNLADHDGYIRVGFYRANEGEVEIPVEELEKIDIQTIAEYIDEYFGCNHTDYPMTLHIKGDRFLVELKGGMFDFKVSKIPHVAWVAHVTIIEGDNENSRPVVIDYPSQAQAQDVLNTVCAYWFGDNPGDWDEKMGAFKFWEGCYVKASLGSPVYEDEAETLRRFLPVFGETK